MDHLSLYSNPSIGLKFCKVRDSKRGIRPFKINWKVWNLIKINVLRNKLRMWKTKRIKMNERLLREHNTRTKPSVSPSNASFQFLHMAQNSLIPISNQSIATSMPSVDEVWLFCIFPPPDTIQSFCFFLWI